MTNLEKLKQDRPELSDFELGLTVGTQCPSELGYCVEDSWHCNFTFDCCKECWNQPYVEPKPKTEGESNVQEWINALDDAADKLREMRGKDIEMIADKFNEIPTVNALSPKQLKEALENAAKDELGIKSPSEAFGVTAEPTIKDSGDRTEFSSGAVRDMREGKGRCDLVPMDVMSRYVYGDGSHSDPILDNISQFQKTRGSKYLYMAIEEFDRRHWENRYTLCLEVAKHFEEGAKKYGESNWQKGIPVHCYIDSAVRHYLKWLRRDKDEPHDRAFVWNLMCCIWEVDYHEYDEVEEET